MDDKLSVELRDGKKSKWFGNIIRFCNCDIIKTIDKTKVTKKEQQSVCAQRNYSCRLSNCAGRNTNK